MNLYHCAFGHYAKLFFREALNTEFCVIAEIFQSTRFCCKI